MPDIHLMHNHLSDLFGNAQCEIAHERANEILEEAEQFAKSILDLNPGDIQATFAIALAWYHRWPPTNRRNCLEWIRKTELLDPDFPWISLYSGYQYFDDGNYCEAYTQFKRVDREFFASIRQHWRNLKTDDLMLVCQIRGDFDSPGIESLTKLMSKYMAAPEEDRPIPSEIVAATSIATLRERFNIQPSVVADAVVRLINGSGFQSIFADELRELESAAKTDG